MTQSITQQDVQAFRRDGVVCLRQAFSQEWLDLAAAGIKRNMRDQGSFFRQLSEKDNPGGFYTDMWSRFWIEEFQSITLDSPAAFIAARFMGSKAVRLLQDVWFVKLPGTPERTPWHHDNVVTGSFCSIWMALDPLPRGTSLEFIRGSHQWNQLFMPESFFKSGENKKGGILTETEKYYLDFHNDRDSTTKGESVFSPTPDIEASRDAYDIVSWDMDPGDCIVFDARTLHGAPGNASLDYPARRFVTRWIGEDAVLAPHGEETIRMLRQHGFEVDLKGGDPIEGNLFPIVWGRD